MCLSSPTPHPQRHAAIRRSGSYLCARLACCQAASQMHPAHWTVVPNPHFCLVSLKPASNSVSNCSLLFTVSQTSFVSPCLSLAFVAGHFYLNCPFSFLPNRIFSPGHSILTIKCGHLSYSSLYIFLKHLFNTSFLPHFCEDADLARLVVAKTEASRLISI